MAPAALLAQEAQEVRGAREAREALLACMVNISLPVLPG